jgi:rhodanese-related sulfurtransferase
MGAVPAIPSPLTPSPAGPPRPSSSAATTFPATPAQAPRPVFPPDAAGAGARRLCPQDLADPACRLGLSLIDVREPLEFASGHIAGSRNIPLDRIGRSALPPGPLLLVCQSGNRSARAVETLLRQHHPAAVADLEGGLTAWQQAGLPLRRRDNAPLPLMRQVQIAAGSLVLLGLGLSASVAPAWIALSWFVGAGLVFAGLSGSCGLAKLLALMPWNRLDA